MHTTFGWQFIGKPPESYRALCGGSKGIKIVGNENDLTQLRDWNVEIKQARLIDQEDRIRGLIEATAIEDIRTLAKQIAAEYAAVATRLNVPGVWWEIPYIMPAVTPKTCAWYPTAAEEFRAVGLPSVAWGFATGTPQVAPWATPESPDEWPQMYEGLARLHALGPSWVRLGVEEYITYGNLIAGDYSNVGRIQEVYNHHIKPHGWNIVFRGIEKGYDVPGMRDAGIIPDNLLHGVNGTGGLAEADIRYASMPFVDCMFLYQVSDPSAVPKEAAFAFTPGDKNGPGYLDVMQQYFIVNPPVPFVPPAGGGGTPPTEPPVEQPPTNPSTVVLFDMALEYDPPADARHFDPGDKFGDRWYPLDENEQHLFTYKWVDPVDGKIAHVEPYPPYNSGFDAPRALRIQNQSSKQQQFWLWLDFESVPGDKFTVSMESAPEIVDGAGIVTRSIVIDPQGDTNALKPGLPYAETAVPNKSNIELTVVATGSLTSVMALFKWKIPLRVNVDMTHLKVTRTRGLPPVDPPTPVPVKYRTAYAIDDGTRVRNAPNTTTAAILWQLFAGESVQVNPTLTQEGWYKLRSRPAFPEAYIRGDLLTFVKPQE